MYKIISNDCIQNIETGHCIRIPNNEHKEDYIEYLKWLENGNIPLPQDVIPEPAPVRDLAKEIDELKAEITALKEK